MKPRSPARKFLAPAARQGDGRGYLNQPQRPIPEHADAIKLAEDADLVAARAAMCDEPEAVGPAVVDAFTDLARTYDRIRHHADVERARADRETLPVDARIRDAKRRAKLRHADISGEMHAVEKIVERATRGGRPVPPAALDRLRRIEARLDYRHDLEDAA